MEDAVRQRIIEIFSKKNTNPTSSQKGILRCKIGFQDS